MCGIAGIWDRRGHRPIDALRTSVELMTHALDHRGPDDHGIFADQRERIALGHRRLSIVDLSPAGRQPMASACGRYIVVFNGELYNYIELRRQLQRSGREVVGGSDTAVLVEMIAHHGVDKAMQESVGMFAIAVWDRHVRTLTLARDRYGIKPLYFAERGGTLAFASEVRALMKGGIAQSQIDEHALRLLLRYRFVPGDRSMIAGVEKLQPNTVLTLTSDGTRTVRRLWEPPCPTDAKPPDACVDEVVEQHLRSAVDLHLRSDVDVGVLLSGGVDSSVVAAVAAESVGGRTLDAFSVGFSDAGADETDQAGRVASALGLRHHVRHVSGTDARDLLPQLSTVFDEPLADSSTIPTLVLARFAREQVKVVLSGDGGDEVFGGYDRYWRGPRLWRLIRCLRATHVSPSAIADACGALATLIERMPMSGASRAGARLHTLAGVLPAETPADLWDRLVARNPDPDRVESLLRSSAMPATPLPDVVGWDQSRSFVRNMMLADLHTFLAESVLTKVDRTSMSVGLECRVPLLDHRLVDAMTALPDHVLLNGASKPVLRRQLDRLVPGVHFPAAKTGFGAPVGEWLRGPLRPWAQDLLRPSTLEATGVFETGGVAELWRQHQSGLRREGLLWPLLAVQSWCQHWDVTA